MLRTTRFVSYIIKAKHSSILWRLRDYSPRVFVVLCARVSLSIKLKSGVQGVLLIPEGKWYITHVHKEAGLHVVVFTAWDLFQSMFV